MSVYFSHPIVAFGTDSKENALNVLKEQGLGVIINPSEEAHQNGFYNGRLWNELVTQATAVAVLPLPDGSLTVGVYEDALEALNRNLPIYVFSPDGQQLALMPDFPGNLNVLSMQETMKQIHDFMQACQNQGIDSIPSTPSADIYFAHPISTYDSELEQTALTLLKDSGFSSIINPAHQRHQEECGREMNNWQALALKAKAIAVLPFEDGSIGAGVYAEAMTMQQFNRSVYVMDPLAQTLEAMPNFPGKLKVLTLEETRSIIHDFKAQRVEQGLSPIPALPNTDLEEASPAVGVSLDETHGLPSPKSYPATPSFKPARP